MKENLIVIRECNKFRREDTTKEQMNWMYDEVPFDGEGRAVMDAVSAHLNYIADVEGWDKPFEYQKNTGWMYIDFSILHSIMKMEDQSIWKRMRDKLEKYYLAEPLDSFLNSGNELRIKALTFEYY